MPSTPEFRGLKFMFEPPLHRTKEIPIKGYISQGVITSAPIINGYIAKEISKDIPINGYILQEMFKDIPVDGYIAREEIKEIPLNYFIAQEIAKNISVNGYVSQENVSPLIDIDGYISCPISLSIPINMFVSQENSVNISSNGYIAEEISTNTSVNGYISQEKKEYISIGGYIVPEYLESPFFSVNGFVAKEQIKDILIEGYISESSSSNISLNGYIKQERELNLKINGLISQERSHNILANGYVAEDKRKDITINGYVSSDKNKNIAVSGYVTKENSSDFSVNGMISQERNSPRISIGGYIIHSYEESPIFSANGYISQEKYMRIPPINGLIVEAGNVSIPISAFITDKDSSLIKAFDIPTEFYDNVGTFYPQQGKASGAVTEDSCVFFAWIQYNEIAGANCLVGRVDESSYDYHYNQHILSGAFDIEGVKVCYIKETDQWAVVWKKGSEINYSIWTRDIRERIPVRGTVLKRPITTHAATPAHADHFDIGYDGAGHLYVLYYDTVTGGCVKKIHITDDDQSSIAISNVNITSANKMLVHNPSGNISVLYVNGTKLIIKKYINTGSNYIGLDPTIVTTCSGLNPLHASILGRKGCEGCVVVWSPDIIGDNIFYRRFEGDSVTGEITPIDTPEKKIEGTGHINISGKSLFADMSSVDASDRSYTFIIKVVDNLNPQIAVNFVFVKVHAIAGQIGSPGILPVEEFLFIDSNRRSPTPIVAVNEFEYAHLYKNINEVAVDVYVTGSVYMGLWQLDDRKMMMFAPEQDAGAAENLRQLYAQYFVGNRLLGEAGANIGDYVTVRNKNPQTATSFDDFLNTYYPEDSIFVGGPIHSPVAKAMHDNPHIYRQQLFELNSEIGAEDAWFSNIGHNVDGFAFDSDAPMIFVTKNGITYNQQRHLVSTMEDPFVIVDYAILLRLAVEIKSTQDTKSIIYIGGINRLGTKVASYCLLHPEKYHLGESSGCLLVMKYSYSYQNTPDWDLTLNPELTNPEIIPFGKINVSNIESCL